MNEERLNQFRRHLARINGIKMNEEQIEEVEKPTTKMSFNDDHQRKAALNLYHRMVGDSLRSGETYLRAHQIGVEMVRRGHGQFGLDHLKNHFKEMKKHAKQLSVDVNKVNEEQIEEADHHILVRVSKDGNIRNMTQKRVVVTTKNSNRDAAMARAERHFRNKGMTVHALKYLRQRDYSPHLDGSSNVREDD